MNKIKVDGKILVVPNGYGFMGFDDEGIPEFNSVVFKVPAKKVEKVEEYFDERVRDTRILDYKSTVWGDLRHGAVTQQLRENFKNVNDEGIVTAHCIGSIRSAAGKLGYSISVFAMAGSNHFHVLRRK